MLFLVLQRLSHVIQIPNNIINTWKVANQFIASSITNFKRTEKKIVTIIVKKRLSARVNFMENATLIDKHLSFVYVILVHRPADQNDGSKFIRFCLLY